MQDTLNQLSVEETGRLQAEADAFGISIRKLIANRQNAEASTGPRTESGRRRSSLNATRHSLTGQLVCKTQEELDFHAKLTLEMMAEHRPEGPSETALVMSVVENTIRSHRARALEDGIFAAGFRKFVDSIDSGHPEVDAALAHSETFLENAKAIALLSTYEQRVRKALIQDREQLKALQAERKAASEKAREEAYKLLYHSENTGQDYDPGDDFEPAAAYGGFVYDREAVLDWADRALRVNAALKFYRDHKPGPNSAPSEPKSGLAA